MSIIPELIMDAGVCTGWFFNVGANGATPTQLASFVQLINVHHVDLHAV